MVTVWEHLSKTGRSCWLCIYKRVSVQMIISLPGDVKALALSPAPLLACSRHSDRKQRRDSTGRATQSPPFFLAFFRVALPVLSRRCLLSERLEQATPLHTKLVGDVNEPTLLFELVLCSGLFHLYSLAGWWGETIYTRLYRLMSGLTPWLPL